MAEDYLWKTRPDQALELVERWIYNPALRELVELDGGEWPDGTLEEVLAALVEFSTIWDKRQGRSRLIFHEGDESRTDERAQLIYSAARYLGLSDPDPPSTIEPDYLLILGGLATGVEPRVRYAAELVESGSIRPRVIAGLGSFRLLHEKEIPISETYAPGARYEIDLLVAMLGALFDAADWTVDRAGDPAVDPSRAELVMKANVGRKIMAFASQSSCPDKRPANTTDTYDQLANHERLGAGHEILLITSAIYRPYQHLQAVRVLGLEHGAVCETIGVPFAGASSTHPPAGYLQEIRSTLIACQQLLAGDDLATLRRSATEQKDR